MPSVPENNHNKTYSLFTDVTNIGPFSYPQHSKVSHLYLHNTQWNKYTHHLHLQRLRRNKNTSSFQERYKVCIVTRFFYLDLRSLCAFRVTLVSILAARFMFLLMSQWFTFQLLRLFKHKSIFTSRFIFPALFSYKGYLSTVHFMFITVFIQYSHFRPPCLESLRNCPQTLRYCRKIQIPLNITPYKQT